MDSEDGTSQIEKLNLLVHSQQSQISELREVTAGFQRDLEVLRKHLTMIEKNHAVQYKEFAEKHDKLAQALSLPQLQESVGAQDLDPKEPKASVLILANTQEMFGSSARAGHIFCEGPLLEAIQTARIFADSKTFVDMPMRADPESVLSAFHELTQQDREDPIALQNFVAQWFDEAGSDLVEWDIPDFKDEPPRLMQISHPEMKSWALAINVVWKQLAKKQKPEVTQEPQRHSFIPRAAGMVVPGGRFREMYYWDTYWVLRGLFICGMSTTALGIIEDLVAMVREFGFVPNGGRIYYLDRSQPPMLTSMVWTAWEELHDKEWLEKVLPALEQEYRFWMDPKGGRLVEMPRVSNTGERQVLNIYRSVLQTPRPESYSEDVKTAGDAQGLGRPAEDIYQALRSAAESGWDFSTRWLEDATGRVPLGTANLATIDASHVIPVDLNSIMYRNEETLAFMHEIVEGAPCEAAEKYRAAAAARAQTMISWLWTASSYRDYRLDVGAHSAVVSLSDWAVPLWAGLSGPDQGSPSTMVVSLKQSGMLGLCGCSVTTVDTAGRTQWDAPNAWPPLVLMLVEGLDKISGTEAFADCLSDTWLRNNFITWQRTGYMHEKYNIFEPGRCGSGGEYDPQVGFGWTNGVALALLVRPPRVSLEPEDTNQALSIQQRSRSKTCEGLP